MWEVVRCEGLLGGGCDVGGGEMGGFVVLEVVMWEVVRWEGLLGWRL